VEAVHWVVVGSGLAAVATAYTLLDTPSGDSDGEGSNALRTSVDVAFYGCVGGTVAYGAVSGHGVAAFGSYFAVAALASLIR